MSIENDINQLNQPPHLSASFTFLRRSRIASAAVAVAVGRVPWAREQPSERTNERVNGLMRAYISFLFCRARDPFLPFSVCTLVLLCILG